jgi:hypothetical protein
VHTVGRQVESQPTGLRMQLDDDALVVLEIGDRTALDGYCRANSRPLERGKFNAAALTADSRCNLIAKLKVGFEDLPGSLYLRVMTDFGQFGHIRIGDELPIVDHHVCP